MSKTRGIMKIFAHKADGKTAKLRVLLKLVMEHLETIRPENLREKLLILCDSDEMCDRVAADLRRWKVQSLVFNSILCETDKNGMERLREKFKEDRESMIAIINLQMIETAQLPIPEFFILLDAPSVPKRFSGLLDHFYQRKPSVEQNVNVDVIVMASEDVKFLKLLEEEIANTGKTVPDWLTAVVTTSSSTAEKPKKAEPKTEVVSKDVDPISTSMSTLSISSATSPATSSATPSSSKTKEDPKPEEYNPQCIADLRPDENGKYFCPAHLMRLPNDQGEYDDDDYDDDDSEEDADSDQRSIEYRFSDHEDSDYSNS